MSLKLEDGTALEERFGPWSVTWRPGGFLLPDTGEFDFDKIVLPLEIVVCDAARGLGDLVITLGSMFRFEILLGAPIPDLERFKKRVSAGVLAIAGPEHRFCSDCARDAGVNDETWHGKPCHGCHAPYCSNPFCLRRLEAECRIDGRPFCRSCRESAALAGGARGSGHATE